MIIELKEVNPRSWLPSTYR